MKTYKAGIIGCGRIASTFEDSPLNEHPCTHAGAYSAIKDIRLVAASDIDEKQLNEFEKKWNTKNVYKDYKKMLKNENLDIISICTPQETHAKITIDAAKANIKAIFSEKPIATNLKDAKKMIKICKKNNIKLVINHTRRWESSFNYAKELIKKGEIGKIVSITGYYTSGLFVIGTHMLDIFRFFCGDVDQVIAEDEKTNIKKLKFSDNFDPSDPPANAYLSFNNGIKGFLHGSCKKDYLIFEIDIHGKRGRIKIEDNGEKIRLWKSKNNKLEEKKPSFKKENRMIKAVNEIIDCIKRDKESISNGIEAYKTLELMIAIKKSAKNGIKIKIGRFK